MMIRRSSEGNGTAAAPCSATKSVSSIICATRPFGTGRSPRVHLEPSLGSTPSKYESRCGVRPARSSRSRSSSGDMDRVLPRQGTARRSAIEPRTDRQIVCGDDRSHASGSDSLIVTPSPLGPLLAGFEIGQRSSACPRIHSPPLAAGGDPRERTSPFTPPPWDGSVQRGDIYLDANRFGRRVASPETGTPSVKWRGP